MKQLLVSILIAAGLFTMSCTKESFITSHDASVGLSADSLYFDTVFTTTGSITQYLRIYNQNDQKLRLSRVAIAGGNNSFFKINVDGFAGPEVKDIEINANDSVYVFVSVKVDPTTENLPFIVQDSIQIEYNGNKQQVKLSAWGQNANFLRSMVITGNQTWTNTKPYVILGGLQVDTNASLTIQKGCRIYMHADAPFIVDGTLTVTGEQYDSTKVIFSGDRLDDPYRTFPAAWPGIYFRGASKDNLLQFAVVKNAYQGIVADQLSINANPKITLRECIVDNCYDAGILGLQSDIKAENCLVSNCGKNVILAYGGKYNFTHCTVVAYSNAFILHKEPVLLVTDFIKQGNTILTAVLNASFTNCIFWGDNGTTEDEVVTNKQGTAFSASFQNCLWKVKTNPANIISGGIIANQNPVFDSINTQKNYFDFRLKENSPAINKGTATPLSIDLTGNPRAVGAPDLGSYERQ
jgi:hypothetical protein